MKNFKRIANFVLAFAFLVLALFTDAPIIRIGIGVGVYFLWLVLDEVESIRKAIVDEIALWDEDNEEEAEEKSNE